MSPVRTIAVVVAAGSGTRMQADRKKQYLELMGVPVLMHTLRMFDRHPGTDAIILVVPETDTGYCKKLADAQGFDTPLHITAGGAERQDSVENGLRRGASLTKAPADTMVMVHDGVRPFVSHKMIDACLNLAEKEGAAIPALKVSDTIKRVDAQGQIIGTLDRDGLYRAQTPQTFRLNLLLAAFAHAGQTGFRGTDEAAIMEHSGAGVAVVPGEETNIKLTTPQDLVLAEFIISRL